MLWLVVCTGLTNVRSKHKNLAHSLPYLPHPLGGGGGGGGRGGGGGIGGDGVRTQLIAQAIITH